MFKTKTCLLASIVLLGLTCCQLVDDYSSTATSQPSSSDTSSLSSSSYSNEEQSSDLVSSSSQYESSSSGTLLLTKIERKEPTCFEPGNDEYYYSADGHIYSDENGINELEEIPILQKLDHDFDNNNICKLCDYYGRPIPAEKDQVLSLISSINHSYEDTINEGGAESLLPSSEKIVINESGKYILEGLYEGGFEIAANVEVVLFLNGTTITSTDSDTISGGKGSKIDIYVNNATNNVVRNLKDSSSKANAVSTKGSLSIQGSGSLSIISECKNGIDAKDILVANTTIEIDSVNHGITGTSLQGFNADVSITSDNKDGINIQSKDSKFTTKEGYVLLNGCHISIDVTGDGIQADTYCYFVDTEITIETTGTYVLDTQENRELYGLKDDDFEYTKTGDDSYCKVPSDSIDPNEKYYALTQSCKGIKCGGIKDNDGNIVDLRKYLVYFNSSNIDIDSYDDSINCKAGNIVVENGTFDLKSNDDGITCDYLNYIKGGDININSFEGIEGESVEITGGTINIQTIDDGINAAFEDPDCIPQIIITGGNITINVYPNGKGDAIDANGRILVSGGNISICTYSQEAYDSDNGTWIDGGHVIASIWGIVKDRAYSLDQTIPTILFNKRVLKNTPVQIYKNNSLVNSIIPLFDANYIMVNDKQIGVGDTITITVGEDNWQIDVNSVFVDYYA